MDTYGFMLIDKPEGITSFDVIRKLRKITGIKKIGHSGTLDPFATGLMILCVGKATRLCSFITNDTKEYLATIQLGIETDTLDMEGKIIKQIPVPPIDNYILSIAAKKMLLLKEHTPPQYSAKKINGKRAYKLAREGKEIMLKPVPIKIFSFEVIKFDKEYITYKTKVSKGTYIRSLSKIFASYLNNIATTIELRRIAVGDVNIEKAVDLKKITPQNYKSFILSPEKVLKNYRKSFLNDEELLFFMNGRMIKTDASGKGVVMVCDKNGKCVGFANIENGFIKPKIVLI